MKKFIALFALLAVLCGSSAPAFAEDAAPAAAVATTEAAAAAEATAPVAAPVPNKGDTSFMLITTVLVIMMSIPG
ncbi:MAG: ammonia channel protein, partial [Sideroxyarcus sp.]